jgi:hypothetical protein
VTGANSVREIADPEPVPRRQLTVDDRSTNSRKDLVGQQRRVGHLLDRHVHILSFNLI